jgi:tRNA-dihydrouridine synthase B
MTEGSENKPKLIRPLTVDTLQIKSNVIIAPLAGITDYPFRQMVRKWGAELTFMEMLPVSSLVANPEKSRRYFAFRSGERPIGIQLVGNNADLFLKAIDIIEEMRPDIIDLNFSCPVRKIINNGSGAAMLTRPEKLKKLVSAIVKHTSIPVSAKIRLGMNKNSIHAWTISRILEDCGIRMVTVHARTADQKYSGPVRLDILKSIKKSLNIPVIGNGGIYSYKDAILMLKYTGVDGIQIGSGILGRYWFIKEIKEFIPVHPTEDQMIRELMLHYQYMMLEYPEQQAIREMRKHVVWMSRYSKKIRQIKNELVQAVSYEWIRQTLETLLVQ